jgi:lipopolysaccharide/colanic/teichoic acid biosynthesis glycosyltransferase
MQVGSRKFSKVDQDIILKGIINEELHSFVKQNIKTSDRNKTTILSVGNQFTIDNLPNPNEFEKNYENIINLKKVNDVQNITALYSAINSRLEIGGRLITCLETSELRKERLYRKFPPVFNSIYYFFDYLGKRVAPKMPISNKVYFFLTANRNRVLTSVEVLGRLVYCGFRIVDTKRIENLLYMVVEKELYTVNIQPRKYGFFLKLNRTGYLGKTITVYKVRTMNAYSEYLQDYIYATNQLAEGGKFKDDYRINFMGKILRKLWLDELPMIFNWLKGDLKLVGPRPLSAQYLSLYSSELKERRKNFKPGLVPPYYADMPSSLDEVMASEMRYFDAYEKSAFTTDVKCFFKAAKNIIINKARSK